MEIYHVTIAAQGRRPLFSQEGQLRRAVRALARVAGSYLVLFYLLDDHMHLVLACSRQRAGRLSQALHAALGGIVSVPMQAGRIRRVETRNHLESLVSYVLGQAKHHHVSHCPALWTGSCFQDLVGARHIEGLRIRATIVRELPRFRLRGVLTAVGLPARDIEPIGLEDIFGLGIQRLVAASTAALSVDPSLPGRTSAIVRARAAIVSVGLAAGFTVNDLARALGLTAHGVRKAALRDTHDAEQRAIRVRLALEQVVARQRLTGSLGLDRPEHSLEPSLSSL